MMEKAIEKRLCFRKPIGIEVGCLIRGQFSTAHTIDISEGGMFVETVEPLPPGTDIELAFLLLKPDKISRINGEVVRKVYTTDRTGIGVKFKNIDEATKNLIRSILTKPDVLFLYNPNILLWVRHPLQ